MAIKITFIGAGSTVFAKNVLGDILLTPEIEAPELALFDINPVRLDDSYQMMLGLKQVLNRPDAVIRTYSDRREALKGADFIVNAIQVGGYKPCTVTDFEIPKKYGLRQTIADTLGIGGIFRALRTFPVLKSIAEDVRAVCPDALFINYTNPMAMVTGYLNRQGLRTVGLCHSVQVCAKALLEDVGMDEYVDRCVWEVAGINHQAWLLKLEGRDGTDLYPEAKRRAAGLGRGSSADKDLVRLDMMRRFGYFVTESSEHNAEYNPWYIKSRYPELIERYNIPLDEYLRRCERHDGQWAEMREKLTNPATASHELTHEFASYIIKAALTDVPYRLHGNVPNTGLITNLPSKAIVEVPCMADANGINPCWVGELPEQCAALNRTNINVQLLTLEAGCTLEKQYIYQAAMMDPHTGSELSLDEIESLVDDLIEAHGEWLETYR